MLKKRAQFLAVAASGKKWVAPGVVMQLGLPREGGEEPRISPHYGLTASKRVGNAVARNRARRRLRALAREILTLHAAPERDYVLIAREATIERDYADLRKDLVTGLKRLGAWRDNRG